MQKTGGALSATSLVAVVVFLAGVAISRQCRPTYQPIAIDDCATILFSHPNALTFHSRGCQLASRHALEGTDWLSGCLQRPQRWLDRLRHWYARLGTQAFGAAAWLLLGCLRGLVLGGLGPCQLPQRLHPQRRRDSQGAAVVVASPVVPHCASHRAGGGEAVGRLVRRKRLVAGQATSTAAAPSATAPQTEGIFFLRLTAGAAGHAKENSKRSHRPTAGAACANRSPRPRCC